VATSIGTKIAHIRNTSVARANALDISRSNAIKFTNVTLAVIAPSSNRAGWASLKLVPCVKHHRVAA